MPDGQIRTQMLEQAGRIPIRRHVKVLGKANPYAREDQVHFEQRQAKRAEAQAIIDEVVTAVQQWPLLAEQAGVRARSKQLVQSAIDKVLVGF